MALPAHEGPEGICEGLGALLLFAGVEAIVVEHWCAVVRGELMGGESCGEWQVHVLGVGLGLGEWRSEALWDGEVICVNTQIAESVIRVGNAQDTSVWRQIAAGPHFVCYVPLVWVVRP